MKIQVDAKALDKALMSVGRFRIGMGQRDRLPALGCVRLEAIGAAGPVLRIEATDLESFGAVDLDVEGSIGSDGPMLVAPEPLRAALKGRKGLVSLETTEGPEGGRRLKLEGAAVEVRGVEDWPLLSPLGDDAADDAALAHVDPEELREALVAVLPAVSKDETRYNLNGVLVEPQADGGVRLTATDGHRLHTYHDAPAMLELRSLAEGYSRPGGEAGRDLIVPGRPLAEAVRLLGQRWSQPTEEMQVALDGQVWWMRATARGLRWRVAAKVIDGPYPDWHHVMPKGPGAALLTLPRRRMMEGLHRLKGLVDRSRPFVRLEWSGGVLEVATTTGAIGEGRERFEIGKRGDDGAVGFNVTYLLDILTALPSTYVAMVFTGDRSGVRFGPSKLSDVGALEAVVMPVVAE